MKQHLGKVDNRLYVDVRQDRLSKRLVCFVKLCCDPLLVLVKRDSVDAFAVEVLVSEAVEAAT